MPVIYVKPSNHIYLELGNSNTDFIGNMAELPDNATAAGATDITIDVVGDWDEGNNGSLNRRTGYIVVTDNGSGIAFDNLSAALSPGQLSRGSAHGLNEHGIGLKQALASLGTHPHIVNGECVGLHGFELYTKTAADPNIYKISELHFDDLNVDIVDAPGMFAEGHGTKLVINNLKGKVPVRRQDYATLAQEFGARYQKFLDGEHGREPVRMTLNLRDQDCNLIKNRDGRLHSYPLKPIKPVWATNTAFPKRDVSLSGDNWTATVSIGCNPDDIEIAQFRQDDPQRDITTSSIHPYYYKEKKIDIFYQDVRLCKQDLRWAYPPNQAELTMTRRFNKRYPRLQIHLGAGFQSSTSKTDLKETTETLELKEQVRKLLEQFVDLNYGNHKPEREALEHWCSHLDTTHQAFIEYHLPFGLRVDAKLVYKRNPEDVTFVEAKAGEAKMDALWQLIFYMKIDNANNGILIGSKIADCVTDYLNSSFKDHFPEMSIETRTWQPNTNTV